MTWEIVAGIITLEQVPDKYKEAVQALIGGDINGINKSKN